MKRRILIALFSLVGILCLSLIVACQVKTKFKLSFIVDDTVYATLDTSGGEAISMPQNPTKDDYVFDGWYWDEDVWQRPFTVNSLLDEPLNSDMSVYAKWKKTNEEDSDETSDPQKPDNNTADDGGKEEETSHTHQYSAEWSSDEVNHWHAATCGHTDIKDKAAHTYVNGVCSTCNHAHENHSYGNYTSDDKNHTQTCTVCQKSVSTTHTYVNGVCTTCGRVQGYISFKNLKLNDYTAYGKVPANTEYFSFIDEILYADGVTYDVFTDSDCTYDSMIPSATPRLIVGDNVFYILARKENDRKLYTVTVRRRPVYTINFVTSGSAVISQRVEEDQNIVQPAATTRTGYTFKNWTLGGRVITFPYLVEEGIPQTSNYTVNLNAVFAANGYTVTLNAADGNLTENEQSVTFDESYNFPVPTRTGYTFLGWFEGENQFTNADGASLKNWTGTTDTTLYAKWQINQYKVTLNKDLEEGGTVSGGGDYAYDSQVTITADTYSGYTWLGWYKENEQVTTEFSYQFKMGFDVTYTAKWIKVTLAKSYTGAGTITSLDKTYKSGESVTVTAGATGLGYSWLGWYNDETELTTDLSYTFDMPEENVTYTAKWEFDEALSNFIFTSTQDTCVISGLKDYGVETIIVPDYVTGIESGAFSGCSNLESITLPFVGGSIKTENDIYQYPFGYIFGTSSYSGASAVEQYYYGSSTSLPTNSTYYIPDSLKTVTITGGNILRGAFYNCKKLKNITISDGVTSIGREAFDYCTSLESITIPDSVTSIGSSAFSGCVAEIKWGDKPSIQEIGGDAFGGYDGTSITIPDSVTYIGRHAFWFCTSLESITIPDSVTSIGDSAFSGCTSLESITLPFVGKSKSASGYEGVLGYVFGYVARTKSSDTVENATYQYYSSNNYYHYFIPQTLTSVTINGGTINSNAFYNCANLDTITLGDSVTSIGSYAFRGCTSLESITIPNRVTSIGNSAFRGCTSLESITIPNRVTSIGEEAFYYCTSLESITIPDSMTSIGDHAFYYCTSLTGVYITNLKAWCNIEFGDEYANPLYYAHNLYLNDEPITEITADMLQGVTKIKYGAFWGCTSLESIEIPDGVTSIDYSAFSGCTKLIQTQDGVQYVDKWVVDCDTSVTNVNLRENTKGIAVSAFYYCKSLENITIPDSVTSIGNSAFSCCTSLENITIPDGVTSIGERAFEICTSLTSITIPDSVTSIGYSAFYKCTSLETVYWNATNCEKAGTMFSGCTVFTTVHIGENVKSIPDYAFNKCTSLQSIAIPDSVTYIGRYAFSCCTSLESITIPDSVTSIGDSAFEDCTSLETVYWNATNCKQAGYNNTIFKGCTALTTVYIGENVESIPNYAFANCRSLVSVNFGDKSKLTSIGYSAFYKCTSLQSIAIPASVTTIGDYAFRDCTNLTSITISESVTFIGEYAFSGCTSLESITIPASVTSIGLCAFYKCTSLESITIPNSITSIGDYAFYYCTSLAAVYYGGNKTQLNSITIGSDNYNLTNATRYYFSETAPDETKWAESDNWWHYDPVTGEIAIWKKD